jgi:hypothetical protein
MTPVASDEILTPLDTEGERTRGGDILRSRAMWESHPLKDLKNESIKDEILTRESTAQDDELKAPSPP